MPPFNVSNLSASSSLVSFVPPPSSKEGDSENQDSRFPAHVQPNIHTYTSKILGLVVAANNKPRPEHALAADKKQDPVPLATSQKKDLNSDQSAPVKKDADPAAPSSPYSPTPQEEKRIEDAMEQYMFGNDEISLDDLNFNKQKLKAADFKKMFDQIVENLRKKLGLKPDQSLPDSVIKDIAKQIYAEALLAKMNPNAPGAKMSDADIIANITQLELSILKASDLPPQEGLTEDELKEIKKDIADQLSPNGLIGNYSEKDFNQVVADALKKLKERLKAAGMSPDLSAADIKELVTELAEAARDISEKDSVIDPETRTMDQVIDDVTKNWVAANASTDVSDRELEYALKGVDGNASPEGKAAIREAIHRIKEELKKEGRSTYIPEYALQQIAVDMTEAMAENPNGKSIDELINDVAKMDLAII